MQRPDLIVGIAGGWEAGDSDAFDRQLDTDFDGYFVGPFVAWKPYPNLVLDLWAGYAQDNVDIDIFGLQGDYDIDRIFVSANATGRWFWGETEIRPKLELFYSNDDTQSPAFAHSPALVSPETCGSTCRGDTTTCSSPISPPRCAGSTHLRQVHASRPTPASASI